MTEVQLFGRSRPLVTTALAGTVLATALVAAAGAAHGARVQPGLAAAGRARHATVIRPLPVSLPAGVSAVGLAADRATGGYWILTSDGGVSAYHAPLDGSLLGHVPDGLSVTAIAADPGGGYRILLSDGSVRSFGSPAHRPPAYGSPAGKLPVGVTADGLVSDSATGGYWILLSNGGVAAVHATKHGSLAGDVPSGSMADAIAAGPGGYRILVTNGGPVPRDLAGKVWNVLPTKRKVVALTFDIGPTDGVAKILGTLRRDHVTATFNVVGRVAREHPATVQAIAAAGELIGDHSNNHPHFIKISDQRIRSEVLDAASTIEALTGRDVQPWFRFPFGQYNAHVLAVVNSVGFVPVGWTVDTLGWKGFSRGVTVRSIVARVLRRRRPGEIVLMHGGSDTPGDNSTPDADALPTVISKLRADGYSFVTMASLDGLGSSQHAVNGRVSSFGSRSYGSDAGRLPGQVLAVGLASDPVTGGYWILLSTGRVDAFHAPRLGGLTGSLPAGVVVTGLAATAHGGYLVLTSDGTVRAFRPGAL